jgi:hypothetical protein
MACIVQSGACGVTMRPARQKCCVAKAEKGVYTVTLVLPGNKEAVIRAGQGDQDVRLKFCS